METQKKNNDPLTQDQTIFTCIEKNSSENKLTDNNNFETSDISSGSTNNTTNFKNEKQVTHWKQPKCNKKKQNSLPPIEMKIHIQQKIFFLQLQDPYQFDEVFRQLDELDDEISLQIKIHYCNLIYRIAKNKSKQDHELRNFLFQLLMKYQSSLLLKNLK